jgi:drug/metabolite transporter (DMT)-like permease
LVGPANIGGDRIHFGGSIALMFACVFWSFGSLHSRRSNLARCPFLSTATQMIAGGVSFIVVGSLSGEWSQLDLAAVSWESVKAVAYLSIFGSILALTAYTWLLRVVEPARVATYAYVNPVVAMLLGWAWLGETLSPRSMVASAIILGSVVLITTARARAANRNATGKAPSPTPDELRVDERQQDFEVASPRCVSGDKATCTL